MSDENAEKRKILKDKLKTVRNQISGVNRRILDVKAAQEKLSNTDISRDSAKMEVESTAREIWSGTNNLKRMDTIYNTISSELTDFYDLFREEDQEALQSELYRLNRKLTSLEDERNTLQYKLDQL